MVRFSDLCGVSNSEPGVSEGVNEVSTMTDDNGDASFLFDSDIGIGWSRAVSKCLFDF